MIRASNQHRDTLSSHLAHYDMLSYFAVAQNESVGRVRYQLLEVIIILYYFNWLYYNWIILIILFQINLENASTMRSPSRKAR